MSPIQPNTEIQIKWLRLRCRAKNVMMGRDYCLIGLPTIQYCGTRVEPMPNNASQLTSDPLNLVHRLDAVQDDPREDSRLEFVDARQAGREAEMRRVRQAARALLSRGAERRAGVCQRLLMPVKIRRCRAWPVSGAGADALFYGARRGGHPNYARSMQKSGHALMVSGSLILWHHPDRLLECGEVI